MNVPKALYEHLTEDATLTKQLSSPKAVFQFFAPEDTPTPFVVFELMPPGKEIWSFRSFYREQLWVIKAIHRGSDPKPAREIDARCEEILNNAPLQIGERLMYFRRESDIEYGEVDGGTLVTTVGGVYRLMSEPLN